jgi:hypothetical protein
LEQDEPGAPELNAGNGGLLMEWAIGKQYDVYRPNTGKLLLPGAQIRWEMHYHASGEATRDHVQLGVYLYPKGQEPKYRTRLMFWPAHSPLALDIPPNSIKETQAFHVLASPARLRIQPHMHLRGKAMAMEAILPDGSTRMLSYGPLQLQLDEQLHLCRRCRAGAAQRHNPSHLCLARQHHQQPEQSRSQPVGRLGRPHGDEMAHARERHLHQRGDYQAWLAGRNRNK